MELAHNRELDIILVGRAGIDFNACQSNRRFAEIDAYTKSVGGSPANIAQGLARLGLKIGFIGKVSGDGMGDYIVESFEKKGIDIQGIVRDLSGAPNCLAITEIITPLKSSSFLYREHTADLLLLPEEIDEKYIGSAAAVLISGTALAQSPSREAVFTILEYAKRQGTLVIMDIDYRPFGWENPVETAIYYTLLAEKCDVIIGNREEFNIIEHLSMPGNRDNLQSAKVFLSKGVQLVVIKDGENGSCAFSNTGEAVYQGVIPVEIRKTFGSGDAYASGLLFGLFKGMGLGAAMALGTACAAIVLTGAISCADAMPKLQEAEDFLQTHSLGPHPHMGGERL